MYTQKLNSYKQEDVFNMHAKHTETGKAENQEAQFKHPASESNIQNTPESSSHTHKHQ